MASDSSQRINELKELLDKIRQIGNLDPNLDRVALANALRNGLSLVIWRMRALGLHAADSPDHDCPADQIINSVFQYLEVAETICRQALAIETQGERSVTPRATQGAQSQARAPCPECGESIPLAAKKCRYCGCAPRFLRIVEADTAEGVRRLNANLLPKVEKEEHSKEKKERVRIDEIKFILYVDEEPYSLPGTTKTKSELARFLAGMIDAHGEYISMAEFGVRSDLVNKLDPAALKAFVIQPGAGCRIAREFLS